MCDFFSFVGDGYGNFLYSDWNTRKANLKEDNDSHTTILTRNKVPPHLQDRWSKYEYNPFTKEFTVDQGVEGHDHEAAENWVQHLNFKKVVEPLVIKKIKNPLKGKAKEVTDKEIALLEQWIQVGDSISSSIWASVWGSVWTSVGFSVWDSISASVWNSVSASVWNSVSASVWNSVSASVWAYISSFFTIKYKHDFSSAVKLWNTGFVPSFDGRTWRLHSGKNAKVVYERQVKE